MYELDANLNLDFLVGLTLIQVCVGEYQLQLRFHPDVNVSIEESVSFNTPSSKSSWGIEDHWTRFPEGGDMKGIVDLLGFLGKTTTAFHRVGKSGLSLAFDDGFRLELYGENERYESYQIGHSGGLIIV
jgi:hypothetical protein